MFIYSCEHCDKKFDRKPNLIRHYSRKFKCYDTSLVKIIKIKDTDGSIIEIIETQNETQNIPQNETQNEPQLETQNITQLEPQITFTKIKLIGKPIRKPIIATQTILPSEENLKQIHISNEHIKNSYIKLKTKEYNSKYRTYKNRKSNKPNQTPILSNYFDTFKKKPHTKRVYFKLP